MRTKRTCFKYVFLILYICTILGHQSLYTFLKLSKHLIFIFIVKYIGFHLYFYYRIHIWYDTIMTVYTMSPIPTYKGIRPKLLVRKTGKNTKFMKGNYHIEKDSHTHWCRIHLYCIFLTVYISPTLTLLSFSCRGCYWSNYWSSVVFFFWWL